MQRFEMTSFFKQKHVLFYIRTTIMSMSLCLSGMKLKNNLQTQDIESKKTVF